MIHLGTDAVASHEGVDLEGEVEGCAPGRHGADFTLGGEDEDFRGEEVELDGVEEVHGVRLWVVEDFLDGVEPVVELCVFAYFTLLVFPVGGEALLRYLVHALRADLHLYPLAGLRHQGDVQRLVAVGLRVVGPVAHAVGVRLVELVDGHVNLEALVYLRLPALGGEDDANGEDVVYLVEHHMLVLHLRPDGIGGLHAGVNHVAHAHLVQGGTDGGGELLEEDVALLLRIGQLRADALVFHRVLVAEAEVLQLVLDLVKPKTVGKGGIYI